MQSTATVSSKRAAVQPWYTHLWPWLLMLGPFLVVVAGMITAWLAYSNSDALVVDDYYKQGKAINQDLRRDHVAAGMKLGADLRYDPASGKLFGTIDSHGRPYSTALFISLVHSTRPEKDLKLSAQSDEQGRFSIDVPMLDVARWQVVIEGEQRDWRLNAAWSWPQQKTVAMKAEGVDG